VESVVARIQRFVDRGVLSVVQGSADLQRLVQTGASDDVLVIAFRCVSCQREFLLLVCKGTVEMR